MKNAIVYSTITGNTKKLADVIEGVVEDVCYSGKAVDEALDSEVLFVGSYAIGNSCTPDIKEFLSKIKNKKVFLFMTAGYGNTDDFLIPVMDSMKSNVDDSNEIIGSFICQGEVSPNKQQAIKKMDEAKYESMKQKLDESVNTPTESNFETLKNIIKAL